MLTETTTKQLEKQFFGRKVKEESFFSKIKLPLILMVLPTLVYVIIFCYIPIGGLVIAFKDYDTFLGIFNSPWTTMGGFQHFYNFFVDPMFWTLIRNTLRLALWSIVVNTCLPIIYALFLNEVKHKASKRVIQTLMYAPYFISVVVLAGILFTLFDAQSGILTRFLSVFGLEGSQMENPDAFAAIYIISGVWQGLGWWSIIYMGSLANVDPNLHDAAKIDGAGRVKRIFCVNFPSILPMCVIVLIMNLGTILSVGFEKVFLMQTDPNLATSNIIATYVYQITFTSSLPQYSYATAIGLFNTVINLLVLCLANFVAKKVGDSSLW